MGELLSSPIPLGLSKKPTLALKRERAFSTAWSSPVWGTWVEIGRGAELLSFSERSSPVRGTWIRIVPEISHQFRIFPA